jgi:bacterioferritin
MKIDTAIMDMLDKMLTAELTAHNLYFVQYQMQENWWHNKLASHVKEDAGLELHHAEEIIQRILYFDSTPDMNQIDKIKVGISCEEHLKDQYDFEREHVGNVKDYIQLCNDKKDFGTKELLDEILEESEQQCDWLETQFQRIKDIGIKNYLTEHMHS